MKLGIISDIHSNILAFRACMEYLEERDCDIYIFLGDYVTDTPYTRETMDYLYQVLDTHTCFLLRGNREEYLLQQREVLQNKREGLRWRNNSASGNLQYSMERLEERDLDFFERLPIHFVYEQKGYPSITFCHGSPVNTRELMQLGGENTRAWMEQLDTEYLVAAHTHHPGSFVHQGRTYLNTGSCGIAIADCNMAQCLLLEADVRDGGSCWRPEFLRIPYDGRQVVEDIFGSGLYDCAPWFLNANIHIFLTGIDKCAELVALAMELQEQETGVKPIWPEIGEDYFARAAKELAIPDYGRQNWKDKEAGQSEG